jgi:hypothetical protein
MGRSDTTFRMFAQLLPAEFRERVFEPALVDLQLDEAEPLRRSHRALARVVLVAECLRLGVPQFFWYRRRPTRLTMGIVGVLVVAMIVVQRLDYGRR